MSVRYCTWPMWLLLLSPMASAQQADATRLSTTSTRGYTVFVGGTVVGHENVTVQAAEDGVIITGSGRLSGSLNIVMQRVEIRYRRDWTPEMLKLEATVNAGETVLQTTFAGDSANTKGVNGGQRIDRTDAVPARALVLPNVFFGSFEALARRLVQDGSSTQFPVFIGPGTQASLQRRTAAVEAMQIGASTFNIRRYELALMGPHGTGVINLYTDDAGSLLRLTLPSQAIDVVRDDLAAATVRSVAYSNPADEAVTIPAAGFNIGATLTWPTKAKAGAAATVPAIVMLPGAAANDRDGVVAGVPMLGQLAGALADTGFVAVRYDKRGHGQSGGRAESATLNDHAEDAVAVVRWLASRRDVDRNRIAVLGHNEGAWTALLAAARERRVAAVIAVAAPATRGAERVLEQQRGLLDASNVPASERTAKIELQNRINVAVMSGRGWQDLPLDVRKQADTPWFQSFLLFDPAKTIDDIRQPLLVVHGEIDREVPVAHADRLGELARSESRSKSVAVVIVRGVNHLLTPAVTGDVGEYASLQDRHVSKNVTSAIGEWLIKAFAAIR